MIKSLYPLEVSAVAAHYDELDPIYRSLWGEHVHHGLWAVGSESSEAAVVALADKVAELLDPIAGARLIDIGCGYGATARRMAQTRQTQVVGLTLSTAQATRAPATTAVSIFIRNWLANGLADESFDHGYAIESSEHIDDKAKFFTEAARVLKPGGRFVVCAWLANSAAASWQVRHLLQPICYEGRMPSLGTREDYEGWAKAAGFRQIGYSDLSKQVARTWTICLGRLVRAVLTDRKIRILAMTAHNRSFAFSVPRLIMAYRCEAMRYGVFAWEKA